MQLTRRVLAAHHQSFGRGRRWDLAPQQPAASTLNPDLKLFAAAFLAGFIFVSVLIA